MARFYRPRHAHAPNAGKDISDETLGLSAGASSPYLKAGATAPGSLVWMSAQNRGNETLTLSLFGYFFIIDDLGNQYTPSLLDSLFPTKVAPGATVRGYASVEQPLHPDASRLNVMFTTVFGSLDIDSIAVEVDLH